MKPEILILIERKYSGYEIIKLTDYPKGMIYRYNMLYKKGCEKIEEMKKKKENEKNG